MDMILVGVKWSTCIVYLDDTIVFSKSTGEQREQLEDILSLLKSRGVSLKTSKCDHLFQKDVEYIGDLDGRGGSL